MIITDQIVEEARKLYRETRSSNVPFATVAMEVVKRHGVQSEEVGPAISDLAKAWAAKKGAERKYRFVHSWGRHKI